MRSEAVEQNQSSIIGDQQLLLKCMKGEVPIFADQ